ncbi:hypothetical protein QR685DRAFT_524325 [Neurospora intermedia]|uniref:Uncharacterized protein n=1 Tax=Neurospora intermedia TaxID=5142 RepID=A0ABR3DDE8_NEUIN
MRITSTAPCLSETTITTTTLRHTNQLQTKMCTKHFVDSYCTSCDELVQGRSTESPCKPKYRGEHLGHCAAGIESDCYRSRGVQELREEAEEDGEEEEERQGKGEGQIAAMWLWFYCHV